MEAVMAAMQAGDYAAAYEALQRTPEAATINGAAMTAILLALVERFDDADRHAQLAKLKAIDIIVAGERQRTARWRDPSSDGGLTTASAIAAGQHYAALATAFVHGDAELADHERAMLATVGQPAAGTLTFVDGTTRAFNDIADADDAIGRMLEAYGDGGLVYFPFEGVRRIVVRAPEHIFDHLMPRVEITDAHGTLSVYVPLLYACSATAEAPEVRTGRTTMFSYLGDARRGSGQRDFQVDGALIGLQHIAAIEFTERAEHK
jgi:protein involved in temperature-dependent protein secretion